MAMSVGIFSTFVAGETPLISKSSSLSSLRFGVPSVPSSQVSLRAVHTVTSATAAKPSADVEPKKREPRGIMKPRRVSPEMREFLGGVAEIPRTQALKEIWAYIKGHDLQDPQDKKVIVCDENLKTIFAGKDRVGFLEIAGLINPHFLK